MMTVVLCQEGVKRHAPDLPTQLKERGVTVGFVECFDKCDTCERRVLARIDGASVAVKSGQALLEMVDVLASHEEQE